MWDLGKSLQRASDRGKRVLSDRGVWGIVYTLEARGGGSTTSPECGSAKADIAVGNGHEEVIAQSRGAFNACRKAQGTEVVSCCCHCSRACQARWQGSRTQSSRPKAASACTWQHSPHHAGELAGGRLKPWAWKVLRSLPLHMVPFTSRH
jgi:hypothetical protein